MSVDAAPKPNLLSDVAYEKIRADINACVLPPGLELTEMEFRDRYDLTIATTRSALTRLSQEGLMRSQPRRGYVISKITLRDVLEVFELRLIVEPGVARMAAQSITAASLANLQRICEDGLNPDVISDRGRWLMNNRQFHVAVAETSGNIRAAKVVERLIDEAQRVLYLALERLDLSERFGDEHQMLVQLIAAHRADEAAEAMREQIASGKDWVVNAILSSRELLDHNLSQLA